MLKRTNLYFLSLFFVLLSCTTDDPVKPIDTFDRSKMLESQYSFVIIPRLLDSKESVEKLKVELNSFLENPSKETLTIARNQWIESYKFWIQISFLDFGPGESTLGTITENIGTFPVRIFNSTSSTGATLKGIETLINEKDYSLDNFFRDTRGFLGLEYLLFSADDSTTILKFRNVTTGEQRKLYTNAVINDIVSNITTLTSQWNGEYKTTFLNSKGTDVGSSTSMLYNSFLKNFEALKNYKVGLPNGSRAGQTKPEPEKVEGYFSGKSIDFLKVHFESIKGIYRGYDRGIIPGTGFNDYLLTISSGDVLVQSTNAQFSVIDEILSSLENSKTLSQRIVSQDPIVQNLYIELSKLTRFIKSDMSSLMGISITFSSSDGD